MKQNLFNSNITNENLDKNQKKYIKDLYIHIYANLLKENKTVNYELVSDSLIKELDNMIKKDYHRNYMREIFKSDVINEAIISDIKNYLGNIKNIELTFHTKVIYSIDITDPQDDSEVFLFFEDYNELLNKINYNSGEEKLGAYNISRISGLGKHEILVDNRGENIGVNVYLNSIGYISKDDFINNKINFL